MRTLKERMTELMLQRQTAAEMEELIVAGLQPVFEAWENGDRSPEVSRKMRVFLRSRSDVKTWHQEAEDLRTLIALIPEEKEN